MEDKTKESINYVMTQNIDSHEKDTIIEILKDILIKLEKKKNRNIIKAAFVGLKDLVIGFGLNVLATYFTNQFPFFR